MSEKITTTEPRIGTPHASQASKDQASKITDYFRTTSPVIHNLQATIRPSDTPNNTHHYETLTSELEVVSNNILLSDTSTPTPNYLPNKLSQNKFTINIVVNKIAGMGDSIEKLDFIVQWQNNKNMDILLGQEANVSF
jgi:hypothetical protein